MKNNARIDPNAKLLFTFQAAGRELGVHPSLLKKGADCGQVQVVKLGRRRLIPKSEIARLAGRAMADED
jgi:hypothetical protein